MSMSMHDVPGEEPQLAADITGNTAAGTLTLDEAERADFLPPAAGIPGRSLTQIALAQLKKDKGAMFGLGIIIVVVLGAVFAPLIVKIPGTDPYALYPDQLDPDLAGIPKFGPKVLTNFHSGITGTHWFGIEPGIGRDVFARVLYGARVSLIFALVATLISIVIGVIIGVTAGYFGGVVDTFLSRLMDVLLAFPFLLFIIALTPIIREALHIDGVVGRISILIGIVGFFGFPYFGRIIRGQVLSMREREYIDAARVVGASNWHILFRQLLPNLAAPILVYATLIIPTNVTVEAALSFLNVGVDPPTASWGAMINDSVPWYQVTPTFLIFPGAALFLTVLGFNLFGDAMRDVFDPKSTR